jgi:hypothetical protein
MGATLDWSWRDPLVVDCYCAGLNDQWIAVLVDASKAAVKDRRIRLGLVRRGRAREDRRHYGVPMPAMAGERQRQIITTALDTLMRDRTRNMLSRIEDRLRARLRSVS